MLLVFFVFKRQDLFQPKLRSAATERAFRKRPEDLIDGSKALVWLLGCAYLTLALTSCA